MKWKMCDERQREKEREIKRERNQQLCNTELKIKFHFVEWKNALQIYLTFLFLFVFLSFQMNVKLVELYNLEQKQISILISDYY